MPPPETISADVPAETPAEPVAPVTAPEAVLSEPAEDVTPSAQDAADIDVDGVVDATFSLLRAEPDGSVVIAGSGQPGAEIQLFANGDLLGETKVEQSGDWVFVPEQPLSTGGMEITLGQNGEPSETDQAFIVVINEDKTSQPLVVASAPGKISEVLQGLNTTEAEPASAADESVEVAMPQQDTAPEAVAEAPSSSTAEAPLAVASADAVQPADPVAASSPVQTAETENVDETPAAADATETNEQTPPEVLATPEAVSEPEVQPADTTVAAAPETVEPEAATATPTEEAVAVAEQVATDVPAQAETETAAVVEPVVTVQPTIDAIELEGERSFFAGAGTNGATIRLYVNDGYIADTTIAEERWLIEATSVLKPGSQRVRVDMLKAGTSEVISRAEVDFVLDIPQAPETVVADAPAETAPAAPEQAPVETASAPEVVEPEASAEATPAEPAVPTMVAVSLGDPNAQRFMSGKAIIRRGDNLWTIARRVYGEGLKYTTIYQANTGQIRDPDKIYPGQVFSLPNSAN